ncbi:hypothetical protein C8035_v004796 [Colletotrichum spinosum]|uniref:NAD-dependent epimerase/dehydratase domain-containing protein n=1 Tax=Colletotrichum spinosum TaxID=1347390 RepID=A0A4V3HTH3_9PEZI|nr:hypothetical protein C8035_v004796 [Colletotrichum spinosum]
MSSKPRILLTGATGYVGGTVLHHLLATPSLTSVITPSNPVTLPVRAPLDRLAKLTATYGSRVNPVPFTSLDDTAALRTLASQHDIVINAGSGFHPASAEALVQGLAARRSHSKTPPRLDAAHLGRVQHCRQAHHGHTPPGRRVRRRQGRGRVRVRGRREQTGLVPAARGRARRAADRGAAGRRGGEHPVAVHLRHGGRAVPEGGPDDPRHDEVCPRQRVRLHRGRRQRRHRLGPRVRSRGAVRAVRGGHCRQRRCQHPHRTEGYHIPDRGTDVDCGYRAQVSRRGVCDGELAARGRAAGEGDEGVHGGRGGRHDGGERSRGGDGVYRAQEDERHRGEGAVGLEACSHGGGVGEGL